MLCLGKVFLNSIEQLDPLSDEWTTFVTMPEKLITPSKSLPVNVIHAEQLDSDRQDIIKDVDREATNHAAPKMRENEDGTLFEMDLEPVENRAPSDVVTDPIQEMISSQDDQILKESSTHTPETECNLVADEDQTSTQKCESISKHVLR